MLLDADVFRALLAMDAYNRGVDAGISISGDKLGTADIGINASTDDAFKERALASGFSAQAYTWNGKTVIAYRGTNGVMYSNTWWTDVFNGWNMGFGSSETDQAQLAIEFYQQLTGGQGGELVGKKTGDTLLIKFH